VDGRTVSLGNAGGLIASLYNAGGQMPSGSTEPLGEDSRTVSLYNGVGVASTPKNLEMLAGKRSVVGGDVRIGGSDGFHQKTVNKYVAVWRLSTQYCGGMEA
jgi:hypothetical protein